MSPRRSDRPPELLAGTLEMLVLRTLHGGSLHGYGIARHIEAASGGKLTIEEGSLYPALFRLEERGDVSAEWRLSPTRRRARFYTLTARGRKRLGAATAAWIDLSGAVDRVLGLVDPPPAPEVA